MRVTTVSSSLVVTQDSEPIKQRPEHSDTEPTAANGQNEDSPPHDSVLLR